MAFRRCQYPDCKKPAIGTAYDRGKDRVLRVCAAHSDLVADRGSPEYLVSCPKCGCHFGVN